MVPTLVVGGLLVFVCTLIGEASSPTWGTARTRGLPELDEAELVRVRGEFKSGRRRISFRPRAGGRSDQQPDEAPVDSNGRRNVVTRLPGRERDEAPEAEASAAPVAVASVPPAKPQAQAAATNLVATVPGAPPSVPEKVTAIPVAVPVAPVQARPQQVAGGMTPVPAPASDMLAPPPSLPEIAPVGPPLNEAGRVAALAPPRAGERVWSMRASSGNPVPVYVGNDAPVGVGPGGARLGRVALAEAARRRPMQNADGYANGAMLAQAQVGGDYPLEQPPGAPNGPFPPGPNDQPPPFQQPNNGTGPGFQQPPQFQQPQPGMPPSQFGGNGGNSGTLGGPATGVPPPQNLSGKTLNVDWKDVDIRAIVKIISDLTKTDYLIEPSLQGKVTLLGPKDLPIEMAEGVLAAILEFQGFAVEGTGPIRRIIRLKTDSQNRFSNFAQRTPNGQIPDGGSLAKDLERIYIHAFRFKNVGVNEMLNIIRFFTGTGNNIIPYVPGNMIWVVDHPMNLRRIKEIVDELDVPGPQRTITTVKINHAQAKAMAEKVGQILQKRTEGETDPGTREFKLSKPSFIADERTNSILLISLEQDVRMLVALIEQLDTPEISAPQVKVVHLQYQPAEAVANQVNQAYKVGGNADPSLQYSVIADPGTQSLIVSSFSAAMIQKVEDLIQFLDNPVTPEGGVNVHHYRMEYAEAAKVEKILSNLKQSSGASSKSAPTKILADEASNSLVIVASQAEYQDILGVLRKLDVLRPQVEVETLIVELSQSLANQFSADFNLIDANSANARGFGLGSTNTASNFFGGQQSGITLGVLAPGDFDVNAAATGNVAERSKIQYLFRMFKSDNRAHIIQSPKLMAADNSTSKLTVGSKVQVLQGLSQGTVAGQLPITNFSSEDLGLSMSLTPRITKGDYVSLKFNVELKDRVGGAAGTINFGPIQTPVFTKTAIENEVMLKNEQTLVIGGLVRENKGKQESKIPGLGDLPLIGKLFTSRNKTTDRNDLLIFLTPHIIRNSFDGQRVTDSESRVLQFRDMPGHTWPHERGLPITARSMAEDLKRSGGPYRTIRHKPPKLLEHNHQAVNKAYQHGNDGRGRNTHAIDQDDDGERAN